MTLLLPREAPIVLVADPDPDACLLYASTLQVHERHVIQATDGREALVKALASPVSLLITETRLPFIDGFSLCEILRRDQATRSVPILVITADARAEAQQRAMQAGADSVIVKPFDPPFVMIEARRLIGRARALCDQAARVLLNAAAEHARTAALQQRSTAVRRRRSKSLHRFSTRHPPIPPPTLRCPSCDVTLSYVASQVGGVSQAFPEQWDFYTCPGPGDGRFQYRHRTRKLRAV